MKNNKVFKMILMAILLALVVVLQTISTFFKIGEVSITLALTPIIVGAIILGVKSGTILGAVFGLIVYMFAAIGSDVGGNMLFVANPFTTLLVCVVKGACAGAASGGIYHLLEKKNKYVAVLLACIVAPICNTGIFCISMPIFFKSILTAWAGGSNLIYYTFIGLIGVNFLIELITNTVLSPAVARVISIFKTKYTNDVDQELDETDDNIVENKEV